MLMASQEDYSATSVIFHCHAPPCFQRFVDGRAKRQPLVEGFYGAILQAMSAKQPSSSQRRHGICH